MSGLVNGLQNRLQQFESARHLFRKSRNMRLFFFFEIFSISPNKQSIGPVWIYLEKIPFYRPKDNQMGGVEKLIIKWSAFDNQMT